MNPHRLPPFFCADAVFFVCKPSGFFLALIDKMIEKWQSIGRYNSSRLQARVAV
jgi:hypothetical protein